MCYTLQGDFFKQQLNFMSVNDVQLDSTTYSTGDYGRGILNIRRSNYFKRILAPTLAGSVTTFLFIYKVKISLIQDMDAHRVARG
jgi:hypothetical protein